MKVEMTEEQRAWKEKAREFAESIRPEVREVEEKGKFQWKWFKRCAELGFTGLMVPEKYGGKGTDTISYMNVIEELSRVSPGLGVTIAVHNSMAVFPVLTFGTESQKSKYLPKLASGEYLGAFSLTEPEAGSDAAAIQCTAVKEGSTYLLTGNKIFVTNGIGHLIVLCAKTDKEKGHRGISAFLVESSFPGFRTGKIEEKMGLRESATVELLLENCEVPEENLLGKEGDGFKIAMKCLDASRMGIGAQSVGIAQGALDEAVKHAKERVQFGKPIAAFQAVQWMVADMATEIQAARLMVHRAAYLKDTGMDYSVASAMAKLYASTVAMRATTKAMQILAGKGYSKKSHVDILFRAARVTEIYEGTSEVQRLVISRKFLR